MGDAFVIRVLDNISHPEGIILHKLIFIGRHLHLVIFQELLH